MSAEQKVIVVLSVIVPLHNEEENVGLLYTALTSAVGAIGAEYELIFVDDGSRDKTFEVAADLAASDDRLRIVKLRRNYGQTPAMVAGIDQARGNYLVTMDGDLQNDPDDIKSLIDRLDEGYDIVVGWRHKRDDRWLTRKVPSLIANWLIGKVTGIPIKDNGCSLKAYRRDVIQSVPLYSDMHRFIPAMASVTGARVTQMKVRHHARRFGVSKYGLLRIYKVLIDLFVVKTVASFAERPLVWFSALAWPSIAISFFATVICIRDAFFESGYSLVAAGVAFLFGSAAIFAILGGVMCEMIYRTGNLRLHELAMITATQPRAHGNDRRKLRS
ncbi:glycosyltransferase family 2 protein [Salinisphaera aquimarina]|uniref:Glycosyltransferase family 2 protein n=1 Tax=Salinisphaera aquimarina TaxID=2094031 RepID=A0ABV7EQ12_9GAMM